MSRSNARLARHGRVRRASLGVGVLSATLLNVVSCSSSSTAPQLGPVERLDVSFAANQVAQGQTANFEITWGRPLPGDTLVILLTGVVQGQTSVVLPANTSAVNGSLPIPAAVSDGTIELHVYVHPGSDSGGASLIVLDTQAPLIGNYGYNAWVRAAPPLPPFPMTNLGDGSWLGGVTFIAGLTDSAQFYVIDNHALAWGGWALGAPANLRDSVPLSGVDTVLSIPMAIPPGLAGTVDSVEFFARDVDGNLATYPLGTGAIAQYADHPVSRSAHSTPVPDLAFDLKHGLVLVADPQNRQVDIFTIAGLTPQATVTLPHAPAGLDVTPGGDSALVLLDSTATVAIINLTNGYSFTTVQLPFSIDSVYPTDTVHIGWCIRIAADDRAVITMRSPDAGVMSLVELNLVTDSQRIVIPAFSSGGFQQPMTRSPDGNLIIMPDLPFPGTNQPTTYTAASHTYQASTVPYPGDVPLLYSTVSNAPNYFLGGTQLIDPSSNVLGYVGMDNWFPGAIAPNGRDAYMPTTECGGGFNTGPCLDSATAVVLHYRVPDYLVSSRATVGQPLDISDAPQMPLFLAVAPDGNTLVGIGPTMLMAFDLTQSGPPSSRRTRSTIVAAMRRPTRPALPIPRAASIEPGAASTAPNLAIHIDRFRR